MTQTKSLSLLGALLVILLASCTQNSQKWTSMMPDADFSNWRVINDKPDAAATKDEIVISGNKVMIWGPSDEAQPLPLVRNFVLSAQVFVEPETASSLWFHHGEQYGYEVIIGPKRLDDSHQTTGSLNNVRNVFKSSAPNGEWFDLEVAVRGKQITVNINNIPVVDYVEPTEPYRISKDIGWLSAGTFVIDSWAGTTRFRDMKLQQLPDELSPTQAGRTDAIDERTDRVIRLQQAGFPVIDFHVHLKGWNKEQALENSRRVGIFYGIAPNCGIGFPLTSDADIDKFLDTTRNISAFLAMQGEGREWPMTFSVASREKFDYVFTDALTFTDHKNRRVRLWIDDEVIIDIPQEQYMDLIVEKTVEVIRDEPIDIFVNPFFLPTAMMANYDTFWTDERIAKVIQTLVDKGVALEINARYRIPNARTIKAAMEAGVPLAFGTNNADPNLGTLEYCFEMMDECGIRAENMYFPNLDRR